MGLHAGSRGTKPIQWHRARPVGAQGHIQHRCIAFGDESYNTLPRRDECMRGMERENSAGIAVKRLQRGPWDATQIVVHCVQQRRKLIEARLHDLKEVPRGELTDESAILMQGAVHELGDRPCAQQRTTRSRSYGL